MANLNQVFPLETMNLDTQDQLLQYTKEHDYNDDHNSPNHYSSQNKNDIF